MWFSIAHIMYTLGLVNNLMAVFVPASHRHKINNCDLGSNRTASSTHQRSYQTMLSMLPCRRILALYNSGP